MTVGTLAILFVVHAFFIAFQSIQEKLMPRHRLTVEEQPDKEE